MASKLLDKGGGAIQLILGPMFSGKSTELLRRVQRHSLAMCRCMVLKSDKDTRVLSGAPPKQFIAAAASRHSSGNLDCTVPEVASAAPTATSSVTTHDLRSMRALAVRSLAEADALIDAESIDVVGVDEGQFFADIVPFCERAANRGKLVIVAALDGTFTVWHSGANKPVIG